MVGCAQALRLYPPAFMITRYGEEAVTIDGCPMPQGYHSRLINLDMTSVGVARWISAGMTI